VIRNNTVENAYAWADEGIEVNAGSEVLVENNTVDVTGRIPWSISIRFPESFARVVDNKIARIVIARDGARVEESRNILLEPEDQFANLLWKVAKLGGFLVFGALLAALPARFALTAVHVFLLALVASAAAQVARFFFEHSFPSLLTFRSALSGFSVAGGSSPPSTLDACTRTPFVLAASVGPLFRRARARLPGWPQGFSDRSSGWPSACRFCTILCRRVARWPHPKPAASIRNVAVRVEADRLAPSIGERWSAGSIPLRGP
jgi:hypothetical protein